MECLFDSDTTAQCLNFTTATSGTVTTTTTQKHIGTNVTFTLTWGITGASVGGNDVANITIKDGDTIVYYNSTTLGGGITENVFNNTFTIANTQNPLTIIIGTRKVSSAWAD